MWTNSLYSSFETSSLNRFFSTSLLLCSEHEDSHPHPEAPKEIVKEFSHFKEVLESGPHFHPEKLESSSSSSSSTPSSSTKGGDVFEDLHDLPKRFWQTPSLIIEEKEMDAIMVSGNAPEKECQASDKHFFLASSF